MRLQNVRIFAIATHSWHASVTVRKDTTPRETTMLKFFRSFAQDESGATAIEYGLIAALIAVAAIVAMTEIGTSLSNTFDNVATELEKGATGGGS